MQNGGTVIILKEPWWKGIRFLSICLVGLGVEIYAVNEWNPTEIPLAVAIAVPILNFSIIILAVLFAYTWPRRMIMIDDYRIRFDLGNSHVSIPWLTVQQVSLVELIRPTKPGITPKTDWYLRLELDRSTSIDLSAPLIRFDTHVVEQSLAVPDNVFAFAVTALPGGVEAVEAAIRQGEHQLEIEHREIQ